MVFWGAWWGGGGGGLTFVVLCLGVAQRREVCYNLGYQLISVKECVFSWNFGVQSWFIVVSRLCRLCRNVVVFGNGWLGIFLGVLLWGLFGGLRLCRRCLTLIILLRGLWRGTGSANLLVLLCGKNFGSSLVFGLPCGGFFVPRCFCCALLCPHVRASASCSPTLPLVVVPCFGGNPCGIQR